MDYETVPVRQSEGKVNWAETREGSVQNRLPNDGLTSRSRNEAKVVASSTTWGMMHGQAGPTVTRARTIEPLGPIYVVPVTRAGAGVPSRSIAPLFINSGNRHVAKPATPPILLRDSDHLSFVRIERDSQNWTKRRSRSGHPIPGLALTRATTRLKLTKICWKSRFSAVLVSSDAVIHLVLSDLH